MATRLLTIAVLFATVTAFAQTSAPKSAPVVLPPGTHLKYIGERESVHARGKERALPGTPNPFEANIYNNFVAVVLDVIVNENGRVDSVHAIDGPSEFFEQASRVEMHRSFEPYRVDGVIVRVRVQDTVSILPPEEWAPVHAAWPSTVDLSKASVTLERTACFGNCPAYTVSVAGDGLVTWDSDGDVAVRGHHTARTSPVAAQKLIAEFRQANFLSANDSYTCAWTDMPSYTLTLKLGGNEKKVEDYGGPIVGMPDAIEHLEKEVDDTAGVKRWLTWTHDTLPALLAERWDFSSTSADNLTLYNSAIAAHQAAAIALFEAGHAPIASTDTREQSPVCVASAVGDSDQVQRQLTSWPKATPLPHALLVECLIAAAGSGNLSTVEIWLDHGARPEPAGRPSNRRGTFPSALLAAIASPSPEVLARILEFKPDLSPAANNRESVLAYSERRRSSNDSSSGPAMLELLLQAGADPNAPGSSGNPPLFDVASDSVAVRLLLHAGAQINAREPDGETPLMRNAFIEPAVRVLLSAGADPTLKAKDGKTALDYAKQYSCPACATLIQEALKARPSNAATSPQ